MPANLALDARVQYQHLRSEYTSGNASSHLQFQLRDKLLDVISDVPEPDIISDLTALIGPEAVQSRIEQLQKDQTAQQGYSNLSQYLTGAESLDGIVDFNKGLSPKKNVGNVEVSSGQYTHSETDLFLKGRGINFTFERTYRSQVVYSGPLGGNWDHSYNLWLRVENGGNQIARSNGSLREDTYTFDFNSQIYFAPDGSTSTLQQIGNSFVMEASNGDTYTYDALNAGTMYRVTSIEDRYGNTLTFIYDLGTELLQSVVDSLGRSINFTHDDKKRIKSVTQGERTVEYEYDQHNNLTQVVKPKPAAHEDPAVRSYEYVTAFSGRFTHNLERIVDGEGNHILENEYGTTPGQEDFNHVVRQRIAAGELIYNYVTLNPLNSGLGLNEPITETIVKHRNGHIVRYQFNADGKEVHKIESMLTAGGSLQTTETSSEYNEDGQLVSHKDELGNIKKTVHYRDWHLVPQNPTPEQRRKFTEVIMEIRQSENSATVLGLNPPIIDPEDIVVEFEHHPLYSDVVSRTDPRDPSWQTKFVYSNDASGAIVEDPQGKFLRRIVLPQTTLPDGSVQNNSIEYEYNDHGQITAEKRPRSTAIVNGTVVVNQAETSESRFYYFTAAQDPQKQGYLRQIRAGAGSSDSIDIHFNVDERGNVVKLRNGRKLDFVFAYDLLDQVTSVSSPFHGATTEYEYNDNGRLVGVSEHVKDPGSRFISSAPFVMRFDYDHNDNLTEVIREALGDFPGTKSKRTFTPSDMVDFITDEDSNVKHLLYNDKDLVSGIVEGYGSPNQAHWNIEYDGRGQPIALIDANGNKWELEYDEFSRVTNQSAPNGTNRALTYDKLGNVTSATVTDSSGTVLFHQENTFDELSRLVARDDFLFQDGDLQTSQIVRHAFYYDEHNNRIRTVADASGIDAIFDTIFDVHGRPIKLVDSEGNSVEREYDENSNLIKQIDTHLGLGNNPSYYVTEYSYNELDLVESVTTNLGNTVIRTYDSRGLLKAERDPLGIRTTFIHDPAGRLIRTVQDVQGTPLQTEFKYTGTDRIATILDALDRELSFEYDELGRTISITHPDGLGPTLQYDGNGNPVIENLPNGLRIIRVFDEMNLLAELQVDDNNVAGNPVVGSHQETYYYDGLGRLIEASNSESAVQLLYDSVGNLVLQSQNGHEVSSEFDALGRRTSLTFPDQRRVAFEHDKMGRLERITNEVNGTSYPGALNPNDIVAQIAYNGSRVGIMVTPFGTFSFTYDGDQRTIQSEFTHVNAEHISLVSLKDAANREKLSQQIDSDGSISQTRLYDAHGRLIESKEDANAVPIAVNGLIPSSVPVSEIQSSPLQADVEALIAAVPNLQGAVRTFEYDLLGNRTRTTVTGENDIVYDTNDLNQYSAVQNVIHVYDAVGNLVDDGTHQYFYDYANRLVRVDNMSGSTIAEYSYDALGRRIAVSHGQELDTLVYDNRNVIDIVDEQGEAQQFVFGPFFQKPLVVSADGQERYYMHDLSQNVHALIDENGVAESLHHSPFGELLGGQSTNPFTFASQFTDSVTGLVNFGARSYSPKLGRFLQRDPINFADGLNIYEYASNDPVNRMDFFGLKDGGGDGGGGGSGNGGGSGSGSSGNGTSGGNSQPNSTDPSSGSSSGGETGGKVGAETAKIQEAGTTAAKAGTDVTSQQSDHIWDDPDVYNPERPLVSRLDDNEPGKDADIEEPVFEPINPVTNTDPNPFVRWFQMYDPLKEFSTLDLKTIRKLANDFANKYPGDDITSKVSKANSDVISNRNNLFELSQSQGLAALNRYLHVRERAGLSPLWGYGLAWLSVPEFAIKSTWNYLFLGMDSYPLKGSNFPASKPHPLSVASSWMGLYDGTMDFIEDLAYSW